MREMIASNSQTRGDQEVKLFEIKFKGSLEKLDEFESDWSNFKSANTNSLSQTTTLTASRPGGGLVSQREIFGGLNTIIEDDDNIDFSSSMRLTKKKVARERSLQQKRDHHAVDI